MSQYISDQPVFRSIGCAKEEFHCADEEDLPPLPPGNYLEPHSHFRQQGEPSAMLGKALAVLQNFTNCECQLEAAQWRIICCVYSDIDGSALRFIASIFRSIDSRTSSVYIVELQKRMVLTLTCIQTFFFFFFFFFTHFF